MYRLGSDVGGKSGYLKKGEKKRNKSEEGLRLWPVLYWLRKRCCLTVMVFRYASDGNVAADRASVQGSTVSVSYELTI